MTDFQRDLIGLIGFVIGIFSFVYAVHTQKQASKLKKYQIGKLRSTLKDCNNIMIQSYRLLKDSEELDITNVDAIKRIGAVHAFSVSLIKSLFHELSEIDLPYNEMKLKHYVSSGLITSKWVWQQAIMFSSLSDKISMPDLPEDTWDYHDQRNA
jgi:hypothetical protein